LSGARRVVVVEGDTISRFATERLLRREDYWVFVTEDAAAALRVASVSAVDLVLVDLGLDRLEAVLGAQRRRDDVPWRGVPAALTDGYAVLRPLNGATTSRFPVVTLRADPGPEPPPPCRFAAVEFLPRPWKAGGLVEGLDAVFRGVVPAPAPAEPSPVPGAALAPPPFASTPAALRTALVVDAEEPDRRAVVGELVLHGFSVHEAATAGEALRLAVARRPWLVITELELPDESGLALCRQMRAHSLLRRTPVVFLSARDDSTTRYEALKAGADEYLAKPASFRELLIRLELLLRRFSDVETGQEPGASLQGAVELVGAPAVLQICHLNQLTGVLVAHRGSRSVRIAFRAGQIVSAIGPDHEGALVVFEFVGWPNGQFAFDRGAVVEGTPMTADFNALLLEGCRRLDERRRGRPAEPFESAHH